MFFGYDVRKANFSCGMLFGAFVCISSFMQFFFPINASFIEDHVAGPTIG